MSDAKIIGTCSKCGGPVTVAAFWCEDFPPIPECMSCGRKKTIEPYGPVIDMGSCEISEEMKLLE